MRSKSNAFWRNYRRNAVFGWTYLVATPLIPIALGVINHFFLSANSIISKIAEVIGLVPFVLFLYHTFKYKFADCPHCKQMVAKFKNLLFPIDPVCPKCGKRMDIDDEN